VLQVCWWLVALVGALAGRCCGWVLCHALPDACHAAGGLVGTPSTWHALVGAWVGWHTLNCRLRAATSFVYAAELLMIVTASALSVSCCCWCILAGSVAELPDGVRGVSGHLHSLACSRPCNITAARTLAVCHLHTSGASAQALLLLSAPGAAAANLLVAGPPLALLQCCDFAACRPSAACSQLGSQWQLLGEVRGPPGVVWFVRAAAPQLCGIYVCFFSNPHLHVGMYLCCPLQPFAPRPASRARLRSLW
jgi:hypothetical protein